MCELAYADLLHLDHHHHHLSPLHHTYLALSFKPAMKPDDSAAIRVQQVKAAALVRTAQVATSLHLSEAVLEMVGSRSKLTSTDMSCSYQHCYLRQLIERMATACD